MGLVSRPALWIEMAAVTVWAAAVLAVPSGTARAAATLTPATVTPSIDLSRLAAPTLPNPPRPADVGARVYWPSCMACHGDREQGLTDEFRTLYPAEDRYLRAAGCHGRGPSEGGFRLPESVPRIVGMGALRTLPSEGILYAFVKATMPFHALGSLDDDQYRQVTAYLLRENERAMAYTATDMGSPAQITRTPKTSPESGIREAAGGPLRFEVWIAGGVLVAVIGLLT